VLVRSTDVPLGIRVTRLGVTDGPMGLNVVGFRLLFNRLTDGPTVCSPGRSTDSLLTVLCGLFVEPIDRWSYAVYLSGRSTDSLLCTSFFNLGR